MNEYLLDTEHMSSNISRFKNVNITESAEYKICFDCYRTCCTNAIL